MCPRCHQLIDAQAIACPHCHAALKAYGHPGIPLFRATGEEFLCATCTYHHNDTCTFPQRPHAKECTLYTHPTQQPAELKINANHPTAVAKRWASQRAVWWIVLASLLATSVLLAWSNQPLPSSCRGAEISDC